MALDHSAASSRPATLTATAQAPRWRRLLPQSLRGKGIAALALAVLYAAAASVHLGMLRNGLGDEVAALGRLHQHERALARAEVAVAAAVLEIQEGSFAPIASEAPLTRNAVISLEGAMRALDGVEAEPATVTRSVRAIQRAQAALEMRPTRAAWLDLRDTLRRVQEEVAILRDAAVHERQRTSERYQQRFDRVTRDTWLLLGAGLLLFGGALVLFFTRLTRDILQLHRRASQIVRGEHGAPLAVMRSDELGRLTAAVNQMSDDLEARARLLELEHQRHAHREKMATLGALASSLAHEINNPLMALGGQAELLADATEGLPAAEAAERGRAMADLVERMARATRHLADTAVPRDSSSPWVDLNALLQPLLQFLRFDRRYRGMHFDTRLAPQLPAVRARSEAVELLAMRLIDQVARAGAADVTGPAPDPQRPPPQLLISTGCAPATAPGTGARVWLRISDRALDGEGALKSSLHPEDRALLVCRAIAESLGGRLSLWHSRWGLCGAELLLATAEEEQEESHVVHA